MFYKSKDVFTWSRVQHKWEFTSLVELNKVIQAFKRYQCLKVTRHYLHLTVIYYQYERTNVFSTQFIAFLYNQEKFHQIILAYKK